MTDMRPTVQEAVATRHEDGTTTLAWPDGKPESQHVSTAVLEGMVDEHNRAWRAILDVRGIHFPSLGKDGGVCIRCVGERWPCQTWTRLDRALNPESAAS